MANYMVLVKSQENNQLYAPIPLDLLASIICFMLEIFLFGTRNLSN